MLPSKDVLIVSHSAGGVFLPDSPNSLLERGFPEQVGTLSQSAAQDRIAIFIGRRSCFADDLKV